MDSVPLTPSNEAGAYPTPPAARASKSELRSYLQTVLGAIILATLIMTFIARAFTVDGPSMQPTLYSGERLIVDKITYIMHPPHVGDVVVFHFPADTSQYYIKRVVGGPGDKVEIAGGKVYVNGVAQSDTFSGGSVVGAFGPSIVPADHYFVLGDNRNNSEDSRSLRVGYVSQQLIIGRALWRYWPLSKAGLLPGSD